jgi:hypothetical protein
MQKWKAVLKSSRFTVAVATILLLITNDVLGMDLSLETLVLVTTTAVGWIAGRTFRKDEEDPNAKAGNLESQGPRP